MKSMYQFQIWFFGIVRRKFAEYLGPPPSENAKKQFHKQNPQKASKPIWNPCTQFRLDCSGTIEGNLLRLDCSGPIEGNLLSPLGLPHPKIQKRLSHKQNPEKASKPGWNPCTQFRLDTFRLFGGNLLSTLGIPPPKMQKNKIISKILKQPPKPDEIHVPNSDWICWDFSRLIC